MTLAAWMSGVFLVLLLALAVGAVVVIVTVTRRAARTDDAREPLTAASAARTHARRIHVAAWCALVLAMVTTATVASAARGLEAGRITGLVLAAGGLTFLTVSALGEITWPRPTGSVRTATLVRRTVRDVTPRPAAVLLAVASGLLLVALMTGGLTALPDGRSYGRTTVGADGVAVTWASSPYPGWFYAVPLALAAAAILVACAGCLLLIARRPAISDATKTWDLAMRQLSAQRVLRGATLALGATAAPIYGLLALPFLREGPWGLAVLLVLGALASIGVGAAAVAVPASTVPGLLAPSVATDAARRAGWTVQ